MDLTSILINTVAGAGGGYLGNMLKKNGLGMIGNLIAGAAGGNVLPVVVSALGMLGSGGDEGGFNLIGLIISLIGGGAGSLLGGLIKKAPAQ
ncbi:MAG: hypothetical protein IPM34_13525 [Saprospiraceae bacterium]|nr:hypothetical protein [Saprospiraceae bacterium]